MGHLAMRFMLSASDMREEDALLRVEFEGQVIGVEALRRVAHQRAERMLGDEAMQLFGSRLLEMLRQVH
jgi:hypothetical protein